MRLCRIIKERGEGVMNIFKKLDNLFFYPAEQRIKDCKKILLEMKRRGKSLDESIEVLDQILEEGEKCNIII